MVSPVQPRAGRKLRRAGVWLPGLWCVVLLLGQLNDYPSTIAHNGSYIALATALSRGAGFVDVGKPGAPPHFNYPFLLPLLLAPARWAFPDHLLPMKLVSAAAALATVLLLPACLGGRRAAMWAALLLATHPLFLVAGVTVDTTAVSAAFALLAIRAVHRYRESSRSVSWRLAEACLWLSAVYFVRTIGLLLLLASAAYLLWHRQWRKAAALALALSVGVAAWGFRSQLAADQRGVPRFFHFREVLHARSLPGQAAYEPANYTEWLTTTKALDRVAANARFYKLALASVLAPGYYIHADLVPDDLVPFFRGAVETPPLQAAAKFGPLRTAVTWVLVGLLAVGIVARLRAGVRLPEVYVLGFLALFLVWPHRHEQPLLLVLPLLLVQLAHGAGLAGRWLRGMRVTRWAPAAAGLLLLAVNLAVPVRLVSANVVWHGHRFADRKQQLAAMYPGLWASQFLAADYLREHAPPGAHVMWATTNADLFYVWSGRQVAEVPTFPDAQAVLAAVRQRADYLVGVPEHKSMAALFQCMSHSGKDFLKLVHRAQAGGVDVHVYRNVALMPDRGAGRSVQDAGQSAASH